MTDERLIEEAAKAIWIARHADGDLKWGEVAWSELTTPDDWSEEALEAVEQARAALAVFEAAHAPTDDEREALDRIIEPYFDRAVDYDDGSRDDEGLRDDILAAGFRRSEVSRPADSFDASSTPLGRFGRAVSERFAGSSEVPEPSAEPKHDASCGERCNHCTICGEHTLYGSHCPDHPNRPEPQGEPSECSNPDCPLERAHSGPCAPKDWQGEPSDALDLVIHAERVGTERDDPLILELAEALRAALRAAGEVGR